MNSSFVELLNNELIKLPKPPILPTPPPPPPHAALLLSPNRSTFNYLSMKQKAYNSYTYFIRNYIDVFNKNINNNWSKQQLTCKQADLSLFDYLSHEINYKVHLKQTNNLVNLVQSSHLINTQTKTQDYLHDYNSTHTGMYELVPNRNSLQFLFNILLVPIVFFSLFVLIIIINMITKMLKRKNLIKQISTPSSPSTSSSTTSSSSSSFDHCNRTASYTSTLNSSADEPTFNSTIKKSPLKSLTKLSEDNSIYLTSKHLSELPTTQYKKNSAGSSDRINKIKLNKLKRLKSFTTVSSNFSTIFTKSYDLNTQHNSLPLSNKDLNEIVTQDCAFLNANNTMPNLSMANKKVEIIHESPFSTNDLMNTGLFNPNRIFPRTNPHFCRSVNNYTKENRILTKSNLIVTTTSPRCESFDVKKNEVNFEFFSSKL